jgi:hypothetical protein
VTWVEALVLVALATWRLVAVVTHDRIGEPVREWAENRWPSDEVERLTIVRRSVVRPRYDEEDRPLRRYGPGFLISCPWCLSAYVSAALVVACALTVGCPEPLLVWPAAWGAACLPLLADD